MSVEQNLIISLLKLAKDEPVLTENVNKDAHVPSSIGRKLLEKLQCEGLLNLKHGAVEIEGGCRLKLAVKAAYLGADIERLSNLLCWQEFEEITAYALKNNGYQVSSNVRFKNGARRWEIDVVGCKKPMVVCIDCKHWQHAIAPSALRRIVDSQIERTKAFADSLPNKTLKLECTKWSKAQFIPCILSLIPSSFKFYYDVPIVPILQLQDFLTQMLPYNESVRFFSKSFSSLDQNF